MTNLSFPAKLLLLSLFWAATNACNQTPPPAAPSATPPVPVVEDQQKPVSDALRQLVEKEMTIPVTLHFDNFKTVDNYAYVIATMQQPNGGKMDFSKTPAKAAAEAGAYSDVVVGLLKNENNTWNVMAINVGPTDVPSGCWWKVYNVPKTLFPPEMLTEECTISAPSIFVDNSGRIYVDGGIGLNFEEMKAALVKSLSRLDKVPNDLEANFGDEILMGTRHEVRTLISEAIAEVKAAKKQK